MTLAVANELEILSKIQEVTVRAAVPIVIAVFKHISSFPESKADKNEIKTEIKNDPDLKAAGYLIKEEQLIDETIKILISQKFLDVQDNTIILTDFGKEAVQILRLKTPNGN